METRAGPEDGQETHVPTDPSVEEKRARKSWPFYFAFLGLNINALIYSLDATILSVAIPAKSFWAGISYILCVVVTQPLYTTVSDVVGRVLPLYFAILLFSVGSIVFATADHMTLIIVGRVLQGLAGGGLDTLSEIVVADMTTLQERSLYLGLMALPIAAGSVLGPSLGAVFSSSVSWRWIGWINLPFLGVSFILLAFFLHLKPIEDTLISKIKRLDWAGITLYSIGTVLFVLPISWAGTLFAWKSWETLVTLVLGIAFLAGFAIYERWPVAPVMPYRLLASRSVKMTLLSNFALGAMLFALLQYVPFYYQAVQLETPIGSAVSMLPTNIVSVLSAVGGVIVIGIIGSGYRWGILLFWVMATVGSGLLVLLDLRTGSSMRLGLPVICSAGIGALMRLLHLPMQASVSDVNDTGLAIGILLTCRLMGGLIGLVAGSTIFSNVFASSIHSLAELPDSLAVLKDADKAVGFIPNLRTLELPREVLDPVLRAYLAALRAIFYTMTGFGGLGLLSSFFIREHSLEKNELGRQQFEG
uniref:Major facilitator superfamily transporter n=1 Tax=Fusarium anthophilum TaxID=48485 RepID=V9TLI2_9HYPO|nr:major facilitator superfamily transporter [Fusarium anthophilum]